MTEVKSGPAFNKVEGSRLVAVMSRDASKVEDYAKRHNVPKSYIDADDLINDPDINAVYIATPPSSHTDYAVRSMRAGKPVYIEKPMSVDYPGCLRIIRASQKYKVPIFVAYYRRTLPGFIKVKDLIQSGNIGNVRFVQIQLFKAPSDEEKSGKLPWRVIPEISGGGHFFDLASHQLDYLDFLFGPIQKVKSVVLNQAGLYKAEDYVSAEFLFSDNIAGTGTWCFNTTKINSRDVIEIIGEKGNIMFSCFSFEPIVLTNDDGKIEFINERPENIQYYLIEQVVRALEGKGTVSSTGTSAARTNKVMDEIVMEYSRMNH